jgi:hypothetical protein
VCESKGEWAGREKSPTKKEKNGPRAEKRKSGGGGLLGWAKRRGRERVWEVFFSFFNFCFKPFQTLNSNIFLTFQTLKLFKPYYSSFQIIFKSFKTSHKQIIKPCIQNMMHKHLLLLNY